MDEQFYEPLSWRKKVQREAQDTTTQFYEPLSWRKKVQPEAQETTTLAWRRRIQATIPAPPPQPPAVPPKREEDENPRTISERLRAGLETAKGTVMQGLMGLADAMYSAGSAVANILEHTAGPQTIPDDLPGRAEIIGDNPFGRIEEQIRSAQQTAHEVVGDPEGVLENVARFGGRFVGEAAKAGLVGGAMQAARVVPAATGLLGRMAAGTLATAPLDIAESVGAADESTAAALAGVIPAAAPLAENALGRAAVELGTSFVGEGVGEALGAGLRSLARAKEGKAAPKPNARPKREDVPLRRRIAEAIDPSIKDERSAARKANVDELTGLANRRAYDAALPAAEADENTAIIVFDANNFGQVNKKVSQQAGDKAIKDIANAIKRAADEAGVGERVFRRGGDEFVVFAPKDVAERVRDRAERFFGIREYGTEDDFVEVTLSGTIGNTFDEADATLQARKAERKAAVDDLPVAYAEGPPVHVDKTPMKPSKTYRKAREAARSKTDDQLMADYRRALRQAIVAQAESDGAGSPIRVFESVHGFGVAGTGKGSAARGRLTQAQHRMLAIENELNARGLDVPPPESAFDDATLDDLPIDLHEEFEGLRDLPDDEVLRRLAAVETERGNPNAMIRATYLDAEARRRGLFDEPEPEIPEPPEDYWPQGYGPPGPVPERNIAAAIKIRDDPEIYTGADHAEAWRKAGFDPEEVDEAFPLPDAEEGFITESGRFIWPGEAAENARLLAQLREGEGVTGARSEDFLPGELKGDDAVAPKSPDVDELVGVETAGARLREEIVNDDAWGEWKGRSYPQGEPRAQTLVPEREVGPFAISRIPEGRPGFSVERVRNPGSPPGDVAVVFRNDDGKPVGILRFNVDPTGVPIHDREWGMLPQVYVDPEYRRRGIATRLYEVAERAGFNLSRASGQEVTPDGKALFDARRARAERSAPEAVAPKAEPVAAGARAASAVPRGFINLRGLGDGLRRVFRKHFTARGNLPDQVFRRNVEREGWISAQERQMKYTLRDYDRELKAAFGKKGPSEEQLRVLDDALKGGPMDNVPENLRPILRQMREEIDILSRRMIDQGMIEGKLEGEQLPIHANVIEQNIGVYATRSYRKFDDPDWASKVPEEVRNKAKAWLRSEYPDLSEEEILGKLEALLYEKDAPIAVLASGGKLGSKDLSILMRRKDIPEEIRALWGEYRDPRINYVRSVTKMAHLIANDKFLRDVMRDGLGEGGFLHKRPIVRDGQKFVEQIAADNTKAYAPLNGLYTTPEIAQAFRDAMDAGVASEGWLRGWMRLVGMVKFSKILLSPMAIVRNNVSNVGFMVANGHWRLHKAPTAVKAIAADILNRTSLRKYRDYYKELVELGVVSQSAHAGELRDVLRDAAMNIDDIGASLPVRVARAVGRVATRAYEAGDDVWKIFAFENELARYKAALPDVPEQELKRRVAEIVSDTVPTYSRVPAFVKKLRRFPVVGTFVSFPAEVIRTGWNTLRLIEKELKDPALRSIGAQRAVGVLLAGSIVPTMAIASRYMLGLSNDDDKSLRRFLPKWAKNNTLIFISRPENGKVDYIDLSYTDPYSYLRKPVMAMLRGEDWQKALFEGAIELMSPFFSEDVLAEKLLDIARNKKKNGAPVYNKQSGGAQIAEDVLAHIWEAFEPGGVTSGKRIYKAATGYVSPTGRSYDLGNEVGALVTGFRLQEVDAVESLRFRARDWVRDRNDASRVMNQTITRKGTVSEAEIEEKVQQSLRARRELFEEMHKNVLAARELGVEDAVIRQTLRSAGISRDDVQALIDGRYRVPESTPLDDMRAETHEEAEELNRRRRVVGALLRSAAAQAREEKLGL